MEIKKRTPSKELQILNILYYRGNLSEDDRRHYLHLKKGYEGEILFDQILDSQLQSEHLIIKDLLLTIHNTTFQIDTLIIFPQLIEFFEVKNFEGEYTYQRDNFYKNTDYKISNPEHQLNRADTLLRQLLDNIGIHVPLRGHVVFVNPEFTLFNAPPDKPFILPTQINSLLRRLNSNSAKLTNRNKAFAEKLVSLHQEDSPYQKLPSYEYNNLKKGVMCRYCHSFSIILEPYNFTCTSCGGKETINHAIMRNTRELNLLFPNEKITTNLVYDWCRITSKQRIRRILKRNIKLVSNGRWSHFFPPLLP